MCPNTAGSTLFDYILPSLKIIPLGMAKVATPMSAQARLPINLYVLV